jgi:hypothetical protein
MIILLLLYIFNSNHNYNYYLLANNINNNNNNNNDEDYDDNNSNLDIYRKYIKLLAIFIIPFNSLINPFLYCLTKNKINYFLSLLFNNKKHQQHQQQSTSISISNTAQTRL